MKKSLSPQEGKARSSDVMFGRLFDLTIAILSIAAVVSVIGDRPFSASPGIAVADRPTPLETGCPAAADPAPLRTVAFAPVAGPCSPPRASPPP